MPVFNVTNSVLSTLTQAQQDNLILMTNTDIRSVLSNLANLSTVQATQAASIALNAAGVTELKAVTVIEKTQVLVKSGFTFAANVWAVNVFHELNNKFPVTAIFDATGDAQFIQFVGKDLMNGTVELTQAQYDSNTFPLNIVLHSKVSTVGAGSAAGQWKLNPITNVSYRLLNGVIEASNDGVNVSASTPQSEQLDGAYVNPNQNVVVFRHYSGYYSIPLSITGPAWTYLTLAQYQGYTSESSAISL